MAVDSRLMADGVLLFGDRAFVLGTVMPSPLVSSVVPLRLSSTGG